MPLTRSVFFSPWKTGLTLLLTLGVCFFCLGGASRAHALDSSSPLFDQGKPAPAEKDKSTQPLALPEETPNPSPGIFSTFLKLVLALALTCGLVFATVWGLKLVWENRGWNSLAEEGKPVKVLTSTYLAPRKAVYLIEVGKRILVVGAGTEELTCLDVITEPDEVEALRRGTQQGFPKIFNKVLQKHDVVEQEEETKKIMQESKDLVGGYLDKLKKISPKKKAGPGGSSENS